MQTERNKDIVKFLRDGQRAMTTFAINADGNDTMHSSLPGAGKNFLQAPLKIGKIQMRVGVGEHEVYQRTTEEAQVSPPPKTTIKM